MFYNHGGGFRTGSGGSVAQDGANLARTYDVVVVQTNHRLGLMGYLFLDELGGEQFSGSGNMGMLDIVAGLEWVHDNIEVFGGDPDNVMIFGESGGGAKTSCLYAMPAAAPFFNKASASDIYVAIMSITMMGLGSLEIAEKKALEWEEIARRDLLLRGISVSCGPHLPEQEYRQLKANLAGHNSIWKPGP